MKKFSDEGLVAVWPKAASSQAHARSRPPLLAGRRAVGAWLRSLYAVIGAGIVLAAADLTLAQSALPCGDARVRIDGALGPRWLMPVSELCTKFAALDNLDPSARLALMPAGDDLRLVVSLRDGRSAVRRVHTPAELAEAVLALMALPARPAHRDDATQPSTPTSAQPSGDQGKETPADMEPKAVPLPTARRFGVELAVEAMARLAWSPAYASLGARGYVALRRDGWRLALMARYDGYQTKLRNRPAQFEMATAGGGLSVTHTVLTTSAFTVHAGLTGWILGEAMTVGEDDQERGHTIVRPRFGALARVSRLGHIHWSLGLDLELSPLRLGHEQRILPWLPPLPAYSAGLSFGVVWEVW